MSVAMNKPYYQTHEPPHCPTCDCGADPTEMEMLRRDAERYRWLRDNAGAWEVGRDPGELRQTKGGTKDDDELVVHGVEYWHELPADPAALTEARNDR